jgi:type IV secretory pathway VirB10-like protein
MSAQNTVWIIAGVAVLAAGVGAAVLLSADGTDKTASDAQPPAIVEAVAAPTEAAPAVAETPEPSTDATIVDPYAEIVTPDAEAAQPVEEIDPATADEAPAGSGDESAEPVETAEPAPEPQLN